MLGNLFGANAAKSALTTLNVHDGIQPVRSNQGKSGEDREDLPGKPSPFTSTSSPPTLVLFHGLYLFSHLHLSPIHLAHHILTKAPTMPRERFVRQSLGASYSKIKQVSAL